ncbi:F0F1 ATP synthase subunit delta [Iodidimonas sp. SYSU 1G8]|uniref:F0F1 ATP synthase subunit delta n=1 Tax=Iodidimonas sp. SYSU 1G8 TaxID=3133967 RepID=UPI0031FE5816
MAAESSMTSGVAGRYAAALFDLAKDAGLLDVVQRDLADLKHLIAENADLAELVRSPLFSRDQQTRAIGAILERAGADPLTRRFLGVVAANRRLFALRGMIDAYTALLAEHRGEMTAEVVSAHPLTDEQANALRDTLSAQLRRTIQLETSVDNSLLGGLIVRVGSRMIDNSLRTKLSNLQLAMKGIG